jgi:hypothetical protein
VYVCMYLLIKKYCTRIRTEPERTNLESEACDQKLVSAYQAFIKISLKSICIKLKLSVVLGHVAWSEFRMQHDYLVANE